MRESHALLVCLHTCTFFTLNTPSFLPTHIFLLPLLDTLLLPCQIMKTSRMTLIWSALALLHQMCRCSCGTCDADLGSQCMPKPPLRSRPNIDFSGQQFTTKTDCGFSMPLAPHHPPTQLLGSAVTSFAGLWSIHVGSLPWPHALSHVVWHSCWVQLSGCPAIGHRMLCSLGHCPGSLLFCLSCMGST
jgi:hypothetical protein